MIIVEGADNVGKTTLVEQLLKADVSLRLLKRKRFNPNRGETIGTSYIRALIPEDGDWIEHGNSVADRMLASECIYGQLFRGGCRMTPEEHRTIENLLHSYGAMIIHCDAPDATILQSWTQRDQMYNDPLIIARAYRERIHDIFNQLPVITYDWTAPNAREQVHHIIMAHSYIQEQMRARRDLYLRYFNSLAALLEPGIRP